MPISKKLRAFLLALLTFAVLTASLAHAGPNDTKAARRAVLLCSKLRQAGIPCDGVGFVGTKVHIAFKSSASASQRATAYGLAQQVLGLQNPPSVTATVSSSSPITSVTTIEDALVILRFEPHNAAALKILEARYQRLKSSAAAGS